MFVIIWGILSDEEKDFVNEIFSEYHGKLYNISLRILRSQQDAEDAVEQTFLKIMDNIERIRQLPCHETLPFCVVIVKNASVDILRKNSKTVSIDLVEEIQELSVDAPENAFFENHDRERLLRLIKLLPQEDRYLLELRLGEEMSYKEIGAMINITEVTARKRFQRALEKLQKLYSEEESAHA